TCFTDALDLTPYRAVPSNIPLDERNPAGTAMNRDDRFWLEKTRELDWSHIDAPDPYWLNRIIWYSIHKGASPYPGRASNPAGPWILIEAFRNGALLTGQESNRVGDDAQWDRLLVNWVGFVAGAEVENSSVAERPEGSAAEPLAAGPALLQEHFVRLGDVKRLVVHLRPGNLEEARHALDDRMIGVQDPYLAGHAVVPVGRKTAVGEMKRQVGEPTGILAGDCKRSGSLVLLRDAEALGRGNFMDLGPFPLGNGKLLAQVEPGAFVHGLDK